MGEGDEDDDEFGLGLWSADVDGDGDAELAIGWRESFQDDDITQGGMVAVGWTGAEDYDVFNQSTPGVPRPTRASTASGPRGCPSRGADQQPACDDERRPEARNARSHANGASRSSRTW